MRRFLLVTCLSVGLAALTIPPTWAFVETLSHKNSVFQLDPTDASGATVWSLDGVDHLFTQQWFYLSATGGVQSINTLGTPVVSNNGRDLYVTYSPTGCVVEVAYHLVGGEAGSHSSDVGETFSITNSGASALQFTLWQYSDFDLMPLAGDDSAQLVNNTTVQQWDFGHTVTEVVSRVPDRWQISNPFAVTGNLTNASAFLGPTNCAWAFQWNLTVDPGSIIEFSKNKTFSVFIAEPGCLVTLAAGLAMLVGELRRRRKS